LQHLGECDVLFGVEGGGGVGGAHNVFFEMPVDVVISGCLKVPFMLVQVIVFPIFG
jgi:hypothetical protein